MDFIKRQIFIWRKMLDISRLDSCGPEVDFWNSDYMNEFVYYDSKSICEA